jgi:hypothetical protein
MGENKKQYSQQTYITVVVWMVAPVVMLMVWFGTSVNSKRCNSNANATVADSIANWSPTHFRGPPLNGMYLQKNHNMRHF